MKRNKQANRAGRKNSTYPKKRAFLVRENQRRRQFAAETGSEYVPVYGHSYPLDKKPWK